MTTLQLYILRVFLSYLFIKITIMVPFATIAIVNYLYDSEK
jgi:hypothetical protein